MAEYAVIIYGRGAGLGDFKQFADDTDHDGSSARGARGYHSAIAIAQWGYAPSDDVSMIRELATRRS